MMARFLFWLSGRLPCRLIRVNDKPYLERYYVGQLLGVTIYLHRLVSADGERHVHNHPWWNGGALVLAGRYDEERVVDMCPAAGQSGCVRELRTVRWFNRVDGNTFHRIAAAKPETWTLFAHGKRAQIRRGMASVPKQWGFLEFDLIYGKPATVFRPFPAGNQPEWWLGAPVGVESGREPFGGDI